MYSSLSLPLSLSLSLSLSKSLSLSQKRSTHEVGTTKIPFAAKPTGHLILPPAGPQNALETRATRRPHGKPLVGQRIYVCRKVNSVLDAGEPRTHAEKNKFTTSNRGDWITHRRQTAKRDRKRQTLKGGRRLAPHSPLLKKSLCGGGVPSSHPSLGLSVFFLSFWITHQGPRNPQRQEQH